MSAEETKFGTPWRIETNRDGDTEIRDANGGSLLGDMQYYPWVPDKETLAYIVRCVNSHTKLLEACEAAKELDITCYQYSHATSQAERNRFSKEIQAIKEQIFAAVAAAREEE